MVTLPPPHSTSSTSHQNTPETKPPTHRLATASARLLFSNSATLHALRSASLKKGDALAVARIAGISAAKMTSTLIPLCHNIPLSGVDVDVQLEDGKWREAGDVDVDVDVELRDGRQSDAAQETQSEHGHLRISVTAKTFGQTGVEMEALVGASIASLAAYDMCKAIDKGMRVDGLRVVRKEGGRSGTWVEGEKVN